MRFSFKFKCDNLLLLAAGESAEIAEEMAARDVLRRFFRTEPAHTPIPLGEDAHQLKLKGEPNARAKDWKRSGVKNVANV